MRIHIGAGAFYGDPSLLAVTVPAGIIYNGVVDATSNSFHSPTVVKVITPASAYVQVSCPVPSKRVMLRHEHLVAVASIPAVSDRQRHLDQESDMSTEVSR